MDRTHQIVKWGRALASALVLSMALTRKKRDATWMALVVGGLACSPLATQVGQASKGLALGNGGQDILEVFVMIALAMAVAIAYGATTDVDPPCWDLGILGLVVAALTSGALAGLGVPVAPDILFGVVLIPVVSLGLWVGVMVRNKGEPLSADVNPGRMATEAALGLVLAMCAVWLTQLNANSRKAPVSAKSDVNASSTAPAYDGNGDFDASSSLTGGY